jgi:hypothetical protein
MRAKLHVELTDKNGELVAVRDATNAVMQAGAQLVARLFAGQGAPITHMGVGTSDAEETDAFSTLTLANGGDAPLTGATEAAIPPEAFTFEVDTVHRLIKVRLRGTLPAAAGIGLVREAGLLSRSGETGVLYNRVTFAPISKGNDHELTLFWEVSFPYGDLQWLM